MRFQATHKLVTYLLVLSAFAALATTGNLGAPVSVGFLACWALSMAVDPGGLVATLVDRVGTLVRIVMVIVFGLAAYQVWQRLPEPNLTPVLYLLLALLAYKLFFRRSNRDYLHIYVLSFLLILAAAALAGTFLFAAAFAFYVVLATWTLILFHLRREMEENYLVKHSAQAPSQKVGVERILNSRRVVGGAFFVATGAVAIGIFGGAVATFALVPRVGARIMLGPSRPSASVIGFSEDVSLGQYGTLSVETQTVALRAMVPLLGGMTDAAQRDHHVERLYWRGTVYDRYDLGHWTRSHDPALRTVLEENGPLSLVREPAFRPPAGETVRQEIEVVGLPGVYVAFALDRPVAFQLEPDAPAELRLNPHWSGEVGLRAFPPGHPHGGAIPSDFVHRDVGGGAMLDGAFTAAGRRYVAYSVNAHAPDRAPAGPTSAEPELPLAVRASYLALPGSLSPRVVDLAARITRGKGGAGERVAAIADWLRSTHEYTLRLPRRPADVDPVEDFIFEHRAGHCEYFATAAAILLRASGIPARYVNGYLGGEWNDIGRYVTVRDNRAHSWVEAYLGDQGGASGWVRVDATPPAAVPVRANRWRQLVESADFYWTRWVVGYDLDRQLDLARRLGRKLGIGAPSGGRRGFPLPGWALVVVAVGVLAAGASRRWSRAIPRPAPVRSSSPRAEPPINRLYRRAVARLGRVGMPRRHAETPREFATRVSEAQARGSDVFEQLTELYNAARFGGREVDTDVLKDVARRLTRLGEPPSPMA